MIESFTVIQAFQLTTSRRGRRFMVEDNRKEWIFQLTTSRRGRPGVVALQPNLKYFNSLPHAEVDRKRLAGITSRIEFQLTTSRRGRRANHQ